MAQSEKYLLHQANTIKAVATRKGEVILEVEMPDAGFSPGVIAAFRIPPAAARELARHLLVSADEAEQEVQ